MCRLLIFTLLLCGAFLAAETWNIETIRPGAHYRVGEEAGFRITAPETPTAAGEVRFSLDGGKTISTCPFRLADGSAIVTGTLSEPGFLRCSVVGTKAVAAAGFDVERITPAGTRPADFDRFWENALAELRTVPADPRLEPLPQFTGGGVKAFQVSFALPGGERLYGFLAMPQAPGRYPAALNIPGAGPGVNMPDLNEARRGVISLTMNVHKYPVSTDGAEMNLQYQEFQKRTGGYPMYGAPDPRNYHFRNVILGLVRAVDFLTGLPEWNHGAMVVSGSSQGGGLTLMTAALHPRVTAAAANVPAFSDHFAGDAGRAPGWPMFFSHKLEGIREMAGYYDVANFTGRIHCPVLAGVGFIDPICPPGSVYAALNRIPEGGGKKIIEVVDEGHTVSAAYQKALAEWKQQQLALPPCED